MSDYIVLYVNKLLVSKESAVFLLSFVIGSKKIKIAGNFFLPANMPRCGGLLVV